jgi:hypothetical protein
MDLALAAYIECALWPSTFMDEDGEEADTDAYELASERCALPILRGGRLGAFGLLNRRNVMGRNTATGTFRTHERRRVGSAVVTIEIADMLDKKLGSVYRDGTHRVVVSNSPTIVGQPRTKTFYGEMAWCNAERYAEDALWFFQRHGDELRHQPGYVF